MTVHITSHPGHWQCGEVLVPLVVTVLADVSAVESVRLMTVVGLTLTVSVFLDELTSTSSIGTT